MRKILYTILALFLTIGLSAQFTDRPGKIQLGYQTTANGLVCLVDSIPNFTPSDENDCYLAQDTTANKLYIYKPSLVSWVEFAPNTSLSIVDSIQFNDTLTINPGRGVLAWNNNDETLDLGINGVILQIGQEMFAHVKNQTGATIDNGAVVRYSGALGASGRITGDLMVADGTFPAMYTLGIATEDIPNGEDGFVTVFGVVRGVNTSAYDAGDILYVSTTVEGALTDTVPESPNPRIPIAVVLNSGSNGSIFIRPTLFPNLNEINDVDITSPVNGQVLRYDGTKWTNSTERDTSDTNEIQYLVFSNDTLGLTDDPTSVVLPYLDQAEISQIIADTTAVILSYVDQAEQDAKDYADANDDTGIVDSTRLLQDSILIYYQDGSEIGRDTIAGAGVSGSTILPILDTTITSDGTGLSDATLETLFDSYSEIRIDAQLEVGAGTDFIISLVNADSVRQKKLFISGVNNSATYEITISGIHGNPSYVIYTGQSIYLQSQLIAGSYEWVLINQAETVTPSQVVSINRDSAFVERGELQDSIKIKISNKALNPLSPNEIPNLWVWFDADSTAYTAGQLVQTWDDLSGNSYDALYTDSVANSPTLRTDGSNLYLDFDGIDDRLDWTASASLGSQEAGTPSYTLFFAIDPNNPTSNQTIISSNSGAQGHIITNSEEELNINHGTTPRPDFSIVDSTKLTFYTVRYDASNERIDVFRNGVLIESKEIGGDLFGYSTTHGWNRIGASIFESDHFDGKIYSVIGYNSELSVSEITGLIGFWNLKYSKPIDLKINQFVIDTNSIALEASTGEYWRYDRSSSDWDRFLSKKSLETQSNLYINNVDSLRNISVIQEGTIIKTRGYYSTNDGGGATYIASQKKTETDDGFFNILSSNGLYVFTYLTENEFVNIKQGGAVGNGVADDFLAVKNVIEKSSSLGLNIYIPAGDYLISESFPSVTYNPQVEVYNGVTVFGEGNLSKFIFPKLDTLSTKLKFLNIKSNETLIKGIHFYAKTSFVNTAESNNYGLLAINIQDKENCVIENCYFTGGYSMGYEASPFGIGISGSFGFTGSGTNTLDSITAGTNVDISVFDTSYLQIGDLIQITDGVNTDTAYVLVYIPGTVNKVRLKSVSNNYSSGATIKRWNDVLNNTISSCYFLDNPGTPILTSLVGGLSIDNCKFINVAYTGDNTSQLGRGGAHAIYSQHGDLSVTNCEFRNITGASAISIDTKTANTYNGAVKINNNKFVNCYGSITYTLLGNSSNPKFGRSLSTSINISDNIFRSDLTMPSIYTISFLKNADELQDTSLTAHSVAVVANNIFEGNEGGVGFGSTLFQKAIFSGNTIISTSNIHTAIHSYSFNSSVNVTNNLFDFSSYGYTEPDGGKYNIRFGRFSGGDPTESGRGFEPVVATNNIFKFGRIAPESTLSGYTILFYEDQEIIFDRNTISYYSQLTDDNYDLIRGIPSQFTNNTIINRWTIDTLQASLFTPSALLIGSNYYNNVLIDGDPDNHIEIQGNNFIRCGIYLNNQGLPDNIYHLPIKDNKSYMTFSRQNDFHDIGQTPMNSGNLKYAAFTGETVYNDSRVGRIFDPTGAEATSNSSIAGIALSGATFQDDAIVYGEKYKDVFVIPTTTVTVNQYGYINSAAGKVDTINSYPRYKNFVVRFKETILDWVTATSYNTGDKVYNSGNVWSCVKNHTSGSASEPSTQNTQWMGEYWIRTGALAKVIDIEENYLGGFGENILTNPTGGTNTVQASNNDIYQATKVITKNTANADSSFVSMFTGTYSTEALISVAATTDSVTVTLPPPSSSLEGHKIKLFNFIVVDNIVTYEILSGQFWSSGVNSTSFEASTDGRIDNLTCIYDPESATYVWAVESNIP